MDVSIFKAYVKFCQSLKIFSRSLVFVNKSHKFEKFKWTQSLISNLPAVFAFEISNEDTRRIENARKKALTLIQIEKIDTIMIKSARVAEVRTENKCCRGSNGE